MAQGLGPTSSIAYGYPSTARACRRERYHERATGLIDLADSVKAMAHGGIVKRPTLALLGERGPEAVIPLSGGGGVGQLMNVSINIQILNPNTEESVILQQSNKI